MQLKGVMCNEKGAGSWYRALGSLDGAIGSPYRPSGPPTGVHLNCLIVGHSLGFNCIGPWLSGVIRANRKFECFG